MSSRELIESLRAASKEKIRLIQQEAEQEAKTLQTAKEEKLEGMRKRYADKLASAEGEESLLAVADAGNRARALRLDAEKALSDRFVAIARSSLPLLRDSNYPAVFEKLVREIPSFAWKLVRVNPADVSLARKYFPDAEIVPVETISGGVDATLADGTIRIINTFEKRLERAWGEMLPLLVKDIYREVSDGPLVQPR
jgi:V/A-type H+/Na+-transporting ATPase subunit E